MAIETEAKFRLADPQAMRQRLLAAGGEPLGIALENNTFFDTPKGDLRRADCGVRIHSVAGPTDEAVRIRTAETTGGGRRASMTYKGPRREGPLKVRAEHEITIDSPDAARAVLAGLGYQPTVSFEKRRESFALGPARVEIDELPELGWFMEIEADDEAAVQAAREKLALTDEPTVAATYLALVAEHLKTAGGNRLAFCPSAG